MSFRAVRFAMRFAFLPALLLVAGAANAQHDMNMAGMGAADSSRAPLLDGLGSLHRAITTSAPGAQRYFDQGLRLTYAFNHDEAQRSFEQGAALDSNCAMCWWGAALTLGPNINLPALPDRAKQAYGYEQAALRHLARATPVEQALVHALEQRYTLPPPADPVAQKRLDTDYAGAMRKVAKQFPSDDDVQVLFAESLMDLNPWNFWTHDGRAQPGTAEITSTLEKVLARDPQHPGANHYYIHAVEASSHPERALASAGRIAALMPGAGHIVHMPSHIYIRTGRYAQSAQANRDAIESDRAYVAQHGAPPGFYSMYVAHNHQFLWATALMQGRAREAESAARHALEAMPLEMLQQMPGFDLVLNMPSLALTRFGRWDEVLKEPVPPGGFPFATAMWHFTRGRAFAGKGALDDAARERDSLAATLAAMDSSAMEGLNPARSLLGLADQTLQGVIAAKQGRTDAAVQSLTRAVAIEDGLSYDEPPDWYYPVRHTLGAVLLDAGRARDAEAVYRADLERHPDNGWALFGLGRSLDAQKKTDEAAKAWTRFSAAWQDADVRLAATDYY